MMPVIERSKAPLFRAEALQARETSITKGHLVRISPAWVNVTFWIVLTAIVTCLMVVVFSNIDEYAVGPALVQLDGRHELTARESGIISEVLVQPGQRVGAGQTLVRFREVMETAELSRVQGEFETQLAKLLRDPADATARSVVASLRTQRDLAVQRLAERRLLAPVTGTINDVRAQAGRYAHAGDVLVSMTTNTGTGWVIAMLPGHYRPMITKGLRLRFEVSGFRYSYQTLTVDEVSDEVIGPIEARRFIGPAFADAFPLTGAVVLVRARLPAPKFDLDGTRYSFFDGMTGTAEVRVRSESLIVSLIPALRLLSEDARDH